MFPNLPFQTSTKLFARPQQLVIDLHVPIKEIYHHILLNKLLRLRHVQSFHVPRLVDQLLDPSLPVFGHYPQEHLHNQTELL